MISLGSKTSIALASNWDAAATMAAEVLLKTVSLSVPDPPRIAPDPPRIASADGILRRCVGISNTAGADKELVQVLVVIECKGWLRRRPDAACLALVDGGGDDHGRLVFLGMAAVAAGSARSDANNSQEAKDGAISCLLGICTVFVLKCAFLVLCVSWVV